ncbi:MAG TPA: hypothetical protein VMB02_12920, partial [Candidatus Aquilonibacter sp.]|nr:hypothetical protein [Candidatus Aquilonibacter sp.]
MRFLLISAALLGCCAIVSGKEPRAHIGATADASAASTAASPAIVIGFVGGYVSHTNLAHMEAHLA